MQPDQIVGVYANFAQVTQSDYEFTLDFSRIDFNAGLGIVVGRINMSPVLAEQVVRALSEELAKYAERALGPVEEMLPDGPDDQGAGDAAPEGGA